MNNAYDGMRVIKITGANGEESHSTQEDLPISPSVKRDVDGVPDLEDMLIHETANARMKVTIHKGDGNPETYQYWLGQYNAYYTIYQLYCVKEGKKPIDFTGGDE